MSSVSLAVVSAGVGHPRPTRLLADQITKSVCVSLRASGVRVELEVLELCRLAADLTGCSTRGPASLDLCEAIAAVAVADGLVVATPVVVTSPSDVFESSFDVLEDGALSGMPVLLAVNSGSRRRPPDLGQVMRDRLACLHAEPVPTVVVAGPEDWERSPHGGPGRLREHIDQAAAALVAAVRPPHRSGR
ncbi:NAD(P)H-dependent oxidoreductase [Actinoallomurus sp. NPDC052274]|uniref:NAD(P)H-dependent oxidoreductase n=1 Tax=Actinoallomurus sp. NPDC052274 TaxID=3155420 RepID=UPI0034343C30